MTEPSPKPSHRAMRDLDIPLAQLKAGTVQARSANIADPLADRVRGEFLEMQGFSPTLQQAGRLFDLPPDECRQVLGTLVNEGFLHEERDGRYRLSRHR